MASYTNLFTADELHSLANLPEVLEAQSRLEGNGRVYFSVSLPETIKATLADRLGLDLSSVSNVPMRWIRGDTHPHVDAGAGHFANTYLAYINDCPGEFVLDGVSYPIAGNTAFVFREGLSHETRNTGATPRLLLGPMSEGGLPVGGSPIVRYYGSYTDAINGFPEIAFSPNGLPICTSVTFNPPYTSLPSTSWRIASATPPGPSSNPLLVYNIGDVLISGYDYHLYPNAPCFLEGTRILCQVDGAEKYVAVEELRKGTLVKTNGHGFKAVELVGNGTLKNPGNDDRIEDRLYKCSPFKYSELTTDLYITGCHSILVDSLSKKQEEETVKHLGKVFGTGPKLRLMACIDERAEPWNSEGEYPIWHFALENEDDTHNYGVCANGGLLVETCSIKFLKLKSNMTLV